MKTILNFFGHLSFIFRPKYWIMLGVYNKAVDEKLLKLAETNDFEPINFFPGNDGVYTVKLGDAYYWIANFPFSFLVEKTMKSKIGNVYDFEHASVDSQLLPS